MTKKIRVYLAMSEDICMYTQQSRCTIYKHKYKLVYQKNCLLPGRPQSFIYSKFKTTMKRENWHIVTTIRHIIIYRSTGLVPKYSLKKKKYYIKEYEELCNLNPKILK